MWFNDHCHFFLESYSKIPHSQIWHSAVNVCVYACSVLSSITGYFCFSCCSVIDGLSSVFLTLLPHCWTITPLSMVVVWTFLGWLEASGTNSKCSPQWGLLWITCDVAIDASAQYGLNFSSLLSTNSNAEFTFPAFPHFGSKISDHLASKRRILLLKTTLDDVLQSTKPAFWILTLMALKVTSAAITVRVLFFSVFWDILASEGEPLEMKSWLKSTVLVSVKRRILVLLMQWSECELSRASVKILNSRKMKSIPLNQINNEIIFWFHWTDAHSWQWSS